MDPAEYSMVPPERTPPTSPMANLVATPMATPRTRAAIGLFTTPGPVAQVVLILARSLGNPPLY